MTATMPNILCLCFEDVSTLMGAYNDPLARTPTIDALAREGVVFDTAHTPQPVCGPSRFALLTGMYPQSADAEDFGTQVGALPRDQRAYPTLFREAGYYCTNNAKENYNSQFDFLDLWNESSTTAHWRGRTEGQPFLAVFNGDESHESSLWRTPGHPLYREVPAPVAVEDVRVPAFLPDTPAVRRDLATAYDYLEAVDSAFAERLRELEDAGVAEDTIVIVYSDHGGITPRTKRFCYDQGTHVPLIVFAPERWRHLVPHAPGSRVADPISHVDLMPTLLSLAGMTPPPHLQGRAYLGPHAGPAPQYVFSGRGRMDERYDLTRAATDGRYRYIRNYTPHRPWGQHVAFMAQAVGYQEWEAEHAAGRLTPVQARFWGPKPFEELYDLRTDPDQIDDLSRDPEQAEVRERMSRALDEHILRVVDNGFIPEGAAGRGYAASRNAGAYPLDRILRLAGDAAAGDADLLGEMLSALDDDNETIRYWGAQGVLIRGEASRSALPRLRARLADETSVPTRIVLAEAIASLAGDRAAVRALGMVLDFDESPYFRLQALSALTAIGERARPVLPAIRRMLAIRSRHVPSAAAHLIRVLEGSYDPHEPAFTVSGGVFPDPEKEDLVNHGQ